MMTPYRKFAFYGCTLRLFYKQKPLGFDLGVIWMGKHLRHPKIMSHHKFNMRLLKKRTVSYIINIKCI